MTTIITRLYESKTTAAEVVAALRAAKYSTRDLDVIDVADQTEGARDRDSVQAAIRNAGVHRKAAAAYADHVNAGKALVVVRAPFTRAQEALGVLSGFRSVDAGVENTEVYSCEADVSDAWFTWPRPSPGLIISDSKLFTGGLMPPAKTKSATPFSSMFAMPKSTSWRFSSMFGMRLLSPGRKTGAGRVSGTITSGFMPLLWRRGWRSRARARS
ncbi:MAG: hypothetical protein QNJ67_18250 [Kiloniellales bacterium]|nr:hypothetical protein [Kiloniellales bacterium]